MTPHNESSSTEPATIERGEALFCEGKYLDALSVFREILSADPTNSAALNNAGITYGALGEIERSFDFLHAALQADCSCAPAFFNLIDLAISCEAVDAGRQIFMLFHDDIGDCNEKTAFEDMLFSPEADALIKERRMQAAAVEGDEKIQTKNLQMINQQMNRLAFNAA